MLSIFGQLEIRLMMNYRFFRSAKLVIKRVEREREIKTGKSFLPFLPIDPSLIQHLLISSTNRDLIFSMKSNDALPRKGFSVVERHQNTNKQMD